MKKAINLLLFRGRGPQDISERELIYLLNYAKDLEDLNRDLLFDNMKLRGKVEANIDVNRIKGLDEKIKDLVELVNKDATGTFRASIDEACELSSLEKDLAMVPKWDIETQQLVRALHSESGIKNFGVSKEEHEALEQEVLANERIITILQKQVAELDKDSQRGRLALLNKIKDVEEQVDELEKKDVPLQTPTGGFVEDNGKYFYKGTDYRGNPVLVEVDKISYLKYTPSKKIKK